MLVPSLPKLIHGGAAHHDVDCQRSDEFHISNLQKIRAFQIQCNHEEDEKNDPLQDENYLTYHFKVLSEPARRVAGSVHQDEIHPVAIGYWS